MAETDHEDAALIARVAKGDEAAFIVFYRLGIIPMFLFSGCFYPISQLPAKTISVAGKPVNLRSLASTALAIVPANCGWSVWSATFRKRA